MSSSHFLNSIRNNPRANRSARSTEPFRQEREYQEPQPQHRIERNTQPTEQTHVLNMKDPDHQDSN